MNKVEKGAPTTLEPVAWEVTSHISGATTLTHRPPDRLIEPETFQIVPFVRQSDAAAIIAAKDAEIERLTRERELITQAVRWAPSSAYWSNVLRDLCGLEARDGINHLESQAREYREQLAAAQKDAERYRWLRNSSVGPSQIWELLSDDCNPPIMTLKAMHELDAAIDATMRKEGMK